jgi:hypothetical protein
LCYAVLIVLKGHGFAVRLFGGETVLPFDFLLKKPCVFAFQKYV